MHSCQTRRGPGASNQVFVDQEHREQPVLAAPAQKVRAGRHWLSSGPPGTVSKGWKHPNPSGRVCCTSRRVSNHCSVAEEMVLGIPAWRGSGASRLRPWPWERACRGNAAHPTPSHLPVPCFQVTDKKLLLPIPPPQETKPQLQSVSTWRGFLCLHASCGDSSTEVEAQSDDLILRVGIQTQP